METNKYEQIPYPNFVFPDTHPARMAASALLFGLSPQTSDKCRVLEIGCGSGLNTLSLAAYLPESEFTAIDPSASQITSAKNLLQKTAFKNVDFINCKIEDFKADSASYDYIICHGVFSWVNKNTQHQILISCRQLLNENGLAYISYNSLPGWHIQNILRDLLIYKQKNSQEKTDTAAAGSAKFVKDIERLFPEEFRALIGKDVKHLQSVEPAYIAHEYLGDQNNPMYFSEFLELLEQHGLKYLAESDVGSMLPREFEPEIQEQISQMSGGKQSVIEQYCDFFRLRRFRKSLIVKDSLNFSRNINSENFKKLWIGARKSHSSDRYQAKSALKNSPLSFFTKIFPQYIPVSEAIERYSVSLDQLLSAVMLDDLELRECAVNCAPSEISTLVRELAKFGQQLPNYRSDNVKIEEKLRTALASNQQLSTELLEQAIRYGFTTG